MSAHATATDPISDFISRWKASGASERANYVLFLTQLCKLLEVPEPDPSSYNDEENAYVFERAVTFTDPEAEETHGRIDLYKRTCFLLEAKQGSDLNEPADPDEAFVLSAAPKRKKRGTALRGTKAWDDAMVRARGQADRYARALPVSEGWPPFLIVVDVGHCIELYSEFSRSGKTYLPYPDPQSFRIHLENLKDEKTRERLRRVWTDPLSLDPGRRSAKVTRELAQRLAALARLLEKANHDPAHVARFLMRCLFTMFAEDVELIPRGAFKELLIRLRETPATFQPMVEELWRAMNDGAFSTVLARKLLRFNGGLFAESDALPLTGEMLELLIEAATADWAAVEPAIFGTLLERALDPTERHKLGAHFTPRAYVERLVMPTIIEPLREEWNAVYAGAVTAARGGDLAQARSLVRKFHEKLCETRVLDPACGSGNFLYVTLEHMKRLEGEVLNALHEFGDKQKVLLEVDPHQFLGIEVNPRAAAIAELVLWIGYLQWHFRVRGKTQPAEPIIKNYQNIESRDALLACDKVEPVFDDQGKPVTRWDGRTTKPHPVTGEEVPDETARVPMLKYVNPHNAVWPQAHYIVGNPPFLGKGEKMREALGDAYVAALRSAVPRVPGSCDFVMYWWDHAAEIMSKDSLRRFGFISTNSLRQTFNRQVLEPHLNNGTISLLFAIPDHPWVDSSDGAAVRIAMTVAAKGIHPGTLNRVMAESGGKDGAVDVHLQESTGRILTDLSIGPDVASAVELRFADGLTSNGVMICGSGFIVTKGEASKLGLGRVPGLDQHIRPYVNGRDLTGRTRDAMVIDLFGLADSDVRNNFPDVFQWIVNRVKPERDHKKDEGFRDKWWLFGRPRPELRRALRGLRRFISTVETSKHRFFVFLDSHTVPDHKTVNFACDDAFVLGVLSSSIHVKWALASGSTLEDRPVYPKTRCFSTFPFPDATEPQISRIRELAEQLDAHRKRQQAPHQDLTMTAMYNVLEKLRSGEPLSAKEKTIHEQGLVSVLKQIHDDLDAAVFAAYGWPATLSDEEILKRLVDLNAERAAEESRGLIRWLRPDFQNPSGQADTQHPLALTTDDRDEAEDKTESRKRKSPRAGTKAPDGKSKRRQKSAASKRDWPKSLDAQAKAVRAALGDHDGPATAEELAQHFHRAPRDRVAELLQTLAALGQARRLRNGRYSA